MCIKPFSVRTCEAISTDGQKTILDPTLTGHEPFSIFSIDDPFELRNAIVPVFKRDMSGNLFGMGTAFHVDGWGGFLTADHVIDFARENSPSAKDWKDIRPTSTKEHVVLLLGYGIALGAPRLPKEYFSPVIHINQHIQENTDPMASFNPPRSPKMIYDIAAIKTLNINNHAKTLPVRVSGYIPKKGDTVLAIGFPKLNFEKLSDTEQTALLNEGMYGAYGRIKHIHFEGTSTTNRTPVIEIEGYWPSGMSGGPVFNSHGEVIGIVSRSLEPDGDNGISYATYLSQIPNFAGLLPSIDVDNPGWRNGWAIREKNSSDLIGFYESQKEAEMNFSTNNETEQEIKYATNRIGSTGVVFNE